MMGQAAEATEKSFEETYPEHIKLKAVAEKTQAISEFLSWCADEKDIYLGEHVDGSELNGPGRTQELIAEFFDIDQSKIETEKRAMLEAMRNG